MANQCAIQLNRGPQVVNRYYNEKYVGIHYVNEQVYVCALDTQVRIFYKPNITLIAHISMFNYVYAIIIVSTKTMFHRR